MIGNSGSMIDQVRQLYEKGDLQGALTLLSDPRLQSDAAAAFWQGRIYQAQKKLVEAKRAFRRALSIDPAYLDAHIAVGRLYADQGRLDAAMVEFEEALREAGKSIISAEIRTLIEGVYRRKAREMIKGLQGQTEFPAEVTLGRKMFQMDMLDDALPFLERLAAQARKNSEAHYWLGKVYLAKGRGGDAISALELSVSLVPDNTRLRLELANAYESLGRFESAAVHYRRILETKPLAAPVRVVAVRHLQLILARRDSLKGDPESALRRYQSLLKSNPNDASLIELAARVFERLGKISATDALYAQLRILLPKDAGLRMRLADLYRLRNDTKKMRAAYVEAYKMTADTAIRQNALDGLGLRIGDDLILSGDFKGANRVFYRLQNELPNTPDILMRRAKIYMGLSMPDRAAQVYRKILGVDPKRADARLQYAELLIDTGQQSRAIDELAQIAKLGESVGEARKAAALLNGLYREKAKAMTSLLGGDASVADQGFKAALSLGRKLLSVGMFKDARLVLGSLVRKRPDAQVYYWLAQAAIRSGDKKAGIVALKKSVGLAPENGRLLMALAKNYELSGQLAEAGSVYATLKKVVPKGRIHDEADKRQQLLQGQQLALAGKNSKALAIYDVLMSRYPKDQELLALTGWAMLSLGRIEESDPIFDRLLTQSPTNVRIRLKLSALYIKQKRIDKAEALYLQILNKQPGNESVRFLLALLYRDQARYLEAYSELDQVKRTSVKDAAMMKKAAGLGAGIKKAMAQAGRKHLDAGELDAAEGLFDDLLKIDPDQASAHYWLSQVYKKRKSYAAEVAALEKSFSLAPDNVLLMPALAQAYLDAGLLEKAHDTLQNLLQKTPYDYASRALLVGVFDKLGDSEKGDLEAQILLKQGAPEPILSQMLDRLGMASGRRSLLEANNEQALVEFGKVLAIVPENPAVNAGIAQVYVRLGNLDAAIAAYLTAINSAADQPDMYLQLASVYRQAGQEDKAVAEYQLVMNMSVAKSWKTKAKSALERLFTSQSKKFLDDVDVEVMDEEARGRLFSLTQKMLDTEAYSSAKIIPEAVLRLRSDLGEAYVLMGRALIGLKRYTDAIVLLKKGRVLHPDGANIRLALADAYRASKNVGMAIKVYESILKAVPDNSKIALILGDLYRQQGQDALMAQRYHQVLLASTVSNERGKAIAGLGLYDVDQLIQQGDWVAAGDIVNHLLFYIPDEPQILLRQAGIFKGLGHIRDAAALYLKILGADPKLSEARLRLGEIYADGGQDDKAIKALEQVARLGAGHREARQAVKILQKIYGGKVSAMVARLTDSATVDAAVTTAAITLGKSLSERGQYKNVEVLLGALIKHVQNAQAYFWLGQAEIKLRKRDAGIHYLEQSVALASNNGQLLMSLATAYESAGLWGRAEKAYALVSRLVVKGFVHDKAQKRAFIALAQRLTQEKHPDRAARVYARLLKRYPKDPQILGLQGGVLLDLGRVQEANRVFEALVQLTPKNLRVRLMLAKLYHDQGDTRLMLLHVKALLKVKQSGPMAVAALKLMGLDKAAELHQQQKWDEALAAYQALLAIVPDNPVVMTAMAMLYRQKNDLSGSELTLKAVLRVAPGYEEAQWMLAQLYLQTKRNTRAVPVLEAYLASHRTRKYRKRASKILADLYRKQINALKSNKRYDKAARVLKKFTRENPDNGRAYLQLGILFMFGREFDLSVEALEQATRLMPNDPAAFHQLALAHAGNGESSDAIAAYAKEISLREDADQAESTVTELLLTLARKYYADDRPIWAIRFLERMRSLGIRDARMHNMLAYLETQQGDIEQAIEVYREGIAIKQDDLGMRYSLGGLYERTNARAAAIAQYRMIVKKGKPGDRYVEAARQKQRVLENQARRFSSNLSYSLVTGRSVIDEQDISSTGAINTSFSSSVNYRLTTTFHPSDKAIISVATGLAHSANHSAQNDSIAPSISVNGNLNYPKLFFGTSASYSESYGLLLDRFGGAFISASLSSGLRFNHPISEFLSLFEFSSDDPPKWVLAWELPRKDRDDPKKMETMAFDAAVSSMTLDEAQTDMDVDLFRRKIIQIVSEIQHGHANAALLQLNQASLKNTHHDFIDLLRGWAEADLGHQDEAMMAYIAVLDRNPMNILAKYSLGRLFQLAKDTEAVVWLAAVRRADAASEALKKAAALRLEDIYVADSERLSHAGMSAGDRTQLLKLLDNLYDFEAYERILPILIPLLDQYPRDVEFRLRMGRILLALGQTDQARVQLETALDLDESHVWVHRILGDVYLDLGDLAAADDQFHWLMTHGDDESRLYALEQQLVGAPVAGSDASPVTAVLSTLSLFLEGHPGHVLTLLQMGDANRRLGAHDEAIALYQQAQDLQPSNRFIRLRLIDAQHDVGDKDSYMTAMRALLQDNQDKRLIMRVLRSLRFFDAIGAINDGSDDTAQALLEQAREVLPDAPLIVLNLGLIYRRLSEIGKARAAFESILDIQPDNLTALWLLGDLNVSIRQLDKGMSQLDDVAAHGVGRQAGEMARAKLQKLEAKRFEILTGLPDARKESRTKTLQSSLSFSKSLPLRTALAQTKTLGFNLSLQLPSVTWGTVVLGYGVSQKGNEDPLGTDYANKSQNFSLSYSRPIPGVSKLSGSLRLSRRISAYDNYDTNARVKLGRLAKRKVIADSLSASLNYQLANQLSLSLAYSRNKSRSDLPVGVVYRPDDQPIAFQSLGLGDLSSQSLNLRLNFRF